MNKERLLNVARALRDAHADDKLRAEFYMGVEVHEACGTPACALGHYAARSDLQDVWKIEKRPRSGMFRMVFTRPEEHDGEEIAYYDDAAVFNHFGIDEDDHAALFSAEGCDLATTPLEAAEFIENYVREAP